MSSTRQPELALRTFAITTRMASMLPPQAPEWAQLIYSTRGSLTVASPVGEQLWYVPARRALWVPAGTTSSLRMRGSVRLRMLYLHASQCKGVQQTRAINVTPLLHEAILEAVRRSVLTKEEPLTGLIKELLAASASVPFMLPMPSDARALRVATRLMREPANQQTLEQFARGAGAGVRTLERVFLQETGISFVLWRRRLRMLESMRVLMDDEPVAGAAEAVGYQSVSAFVAAFKSTVGETPGKWRRH